MYIYGYIYKTNYFKESWRYRVTWSLSVKQQRRSSGQPHAPSVATLVGRRLKPTSITSGTPRQVSKQRNARSIWVRAGPHVDSRGSNWKTLWLVGVVKYNGWVGAGTRLSHGLLSPNVRSKSKSWPMKLKLGEMLDFFILTMSYASFMDRLSFCMRYATVTVTERLIPARQWTRTPHFSPRASSEGGKKRRDG